MSDFFTRREKKRYLNPLIGFGSGLVEKIPSGWGKLPLHVVKDIFKLIYIKSAARVQKQKYALVLRFLRAFFKHPAESSKWARRLPPSPFLENPSALFGNSESS